MKRVLSVLGLGIAAVIGAHTLAYYIISFLPDPFVILLGIFSGNIEALEAVRLGNVLPGYFITLKNLLQGDLGLTLDRTQVVNEIGSAILYSIPKVVIIIIGIIFYARYIFLYSKLNRYLLSVASFFVFMPAFTFPLAIFGAIQYHLLYEFTEVIELLLLTGCVVSIAIGPLALATIQAYRVMEDHLTKQHVRQLIAIGATELQIRYSLLGNFYYEWLPSLEKLVASTLTFLVFSEFIFNLPGLGKLTIRAVTRADWNLILGLVVFYALVLNLSRVLTVFLQERITHHS